MALTLQGEMRRLVQEAERELESIKQAVAQAGHVDGEEAVPTQPRPQAKSPKANAKTPEGHPPSLSQRLAKLRAS